MLYSKTLGFAITASFNAQVHISHGRYRNIKFKGSSTDTPAKSSSLPAGIVRGRVAALSLKFETVRKTIQNTPSSSVRSTPATTPASTPLAVPLQDTLPKAVRNLQGCNEGITTQVQNPPSSSKCSTPATTPASTPLAVPLQDTLPKAGRKLQGGAKRNLNMDNVDPNIDFKQKLKFELAHFQSLCQKYLQRTTIDYSKLEDVIEANMFANLTQQVEMECPVLANILNIIVESKDDNKLKTQAEKLLRAVHAHACLAKLANQWSTSFPLYLGILMVSFGCGEGKRKFKFCIFILQWLQQC